MADFNGHLRSNSFLVKDQKIFEKWIGDISYGEIETFAYEEDGTVGFCGYCAVPSYDPETDEDINFLEILATHLQDEEVAIVFEVGSEKLRYLVGLAWAVDHTGEILEVNLNEIYREASENFIGNNIRKAW